MGKWPICSPSLGNHFSKYSASKHNLLGLKYCADGNFQSYRVFVNKLNTGLVAR